VNRGPAVATNRLALQFHARVKTMSRLVSRILLSVFMFPLAAVLYIFVFVGADENLRGVGYPNRDVATFLVTDIATWLFVAVYWCLLWRSGVNWNRGRVIGTQIAAVGAVIAGSLAGFVAGSLMARGDAGFGVFFGGVLAIVLWLVATVLLWRETAGERAERMKGASKSAVTCPTCGYNLTGLSESRCPECGSRFTLDELLALQTRTDKDIE
jgi:hypothetical protein